MNFDFSEEQTMIQRSVERFVQEKYDLDNRIELSKNELGYSFENWNSMAELGWLGLPFEESDGGFGGNQIDVLLIMEQFGRGLVLEPYLASIVMGGGALKRSDSTKMKEEFIPGLIDGSRHIAFAYAENQSRFDLEDVQTSAIKAKEGFILNGQKSMVQNAESSDQIIVTARTSNSNTSKKGISLFLVDTNQEGITCENFPTVDGLRASEINLKDVHISPDRLVGPIDEGFKILQGVSNDAILALCAEAIGIMEILYKDTLEYTQQREQFDHPLSEFQVIQHKLVDMFMEYEQCKSLLYRATMESVEGETSAQRTVHALKHLIGKSGVFIGENSVQLHGGMGVTEELRIGHYFKRLIIIDSIFGNSDYHLQKFIYLF